MSSPNFLCSILEYFVQKTLDLLFNNLFLKISFFTLYCNASENIINASQSYLRHILRYWIKAWTIAGINPLFACQKSPLFFTTTSAKTILTSQRVKMLQLHNNGIRKMSTEVVPVSFFNLTLSAPIPDRVKKLS